MTTLQPPDLRLPELLAPAGNWDCARAAVENGADAIYFGLEKFNARMRADNFTVADLPELMKFLHGRGVKGYATFNTLVFTEELGAAEQYLRALIRTGVDAVIVQDVGLCRLIRHLSPDFPIHASTQMTITSAAGVAFAADLGCNLVVLARECSISEITKIQRQLQERPLAMPLEVFVHGALCVAYSGQCLTSEALGGRSANRGECAQACRMPYELVVDGETLDLGNRRYLLSPQDLAGLPVLPELIRAGVTCLKIEGRLKAPEYVASVTRTYRQALDQIAQGLPHRVTESSRYELEMAFSRGLYTGWLQGIDNQTLVHGEFAKKRGVYLGQVTRIENGRELRIALRTPTPIRAGDGVVFAQQPSRSQKPMRQPPAGSATSEPELGGRVYAVNQQGSETILTFGRRDTKLRRVRVGDRLWKTSDPHLEQELRQSYSAEGPRLQRPLQLEVHGKAEQALTLLARDELGFTVAVTSTLPLIAAHTQGLDTERLRTQLGRLGNTPFYLAELHNHLEGDVLLPVSEINRLRRELVQQLEVLRTQPRRWQLHQTSYLELLPTLSMATPNSPPLPELTVLVRNLEQLRAFLPQGLSTLYCEFEDPRRYREAVSLAQQHAPGTQIWVAPPRIFKPGEAYILEQVSAANANGYLIRNYDQLEFFRGQPCRGDFSLNIANPLTAQYLRQTFNLERLTASYDLNAGQLITLLQHCPPEWLEITIHQHMPMFHMEHCVFCAFLSDGTDYTNCGRPCEQHQVKLRDRTGVEHLLQADAGCRNTVFNGRAQTGAEAVPRLLAAGACHLRLEFINESPGQALKILNNYKQLLQGKITGVHLWQELRLQNQLGVTRGSQ